MHRVIRSVVASGLACYAGLPHTTQSIDLCKLGLGPWLTGCGLPDRSVPSLLALKVQPTSLSLERQCDASPGHPYCCIVYMVSSNYCCEPWNRNSEHLVHCLASPLVLLAS
ncbi:uncharacterized protein B0I36DRAFT_129672 [Microdochium trichocladiopsis]|uniref:Uncharacterized protein n=1 Tax=Microdochium trichocladiopsis TaxID=1682393 RepID=A0A9P9BM38_9PEZI|nr:uncharacterized protein B0I36DRAFT_129672 [Microdochium trichocladiopsis]KAH7029228.1 hypothetical protein B0I36DRAFT_129672 [Microdochium trichocladiopsis]